MIELMYITNNPRVATIAEKSGVDRLWIDMEWMGKEERQPGMDTVKSAHTLQDISVLKGVLTKSNLMVRVNPIHDNSRQEIDESIRRGAEIVMLPMWKTLDEVKRFVDYVDGRAVVNLLLETKEGMEIVDDVVKIPGVDEIHIGLNDLHLSLHKKFMFELLTDGTVDAICNKLCKNHKYGFGGIGRIGGGMLPASNILAEHVRLGSSMVILSRTFCNSGHVDNWDSLEESFKSGVRDLRQAETQFKQYSVEDLMQLHYDTQEKVKQIVNSL